MELPKLNITQLKTGYTERELEEKFGIKTLLNGLKISFIVESYFQYDHLISLLQSAQRKNETTKPAYFFRGLKNSNFELKSSLRVNGLEENESHIITELYNLHPDEFQNCNSTFEMLAKMRHHGLPTRFIDFTRNPLISLWFACEADGDNDGIIYAIASKQNSRPRRMSEILSKLALYDRGRDMLDENSLYEYLGVQDLKYYIQQMWTCGATMFLEPPQIDQREVNQQSIFMAECNELYRVYWDNNGQQTEFVTQENYYQFANKYLREIPTGVDHLVCGSLKAVNTYRGYNDVRIIIPHKIKEDMLSELEIRGIDTSFIYPTISNSVEKIKKRY